MDKIHNNNNVFHIIPTLSSYFYKYCQNVIVFRRRKKNRSGMCVKMKSWNYCVKKKKKKTNLNEWQTA